jgi:hypothetical protein
MFYNSPAACPSHARGSGRVVPEADARGTCSNTDEDQRPVVVVGKRPTPHQFGRIWRQHPVD